MNTNNIKSFAKEARLLLLEGVTQRLKFWGFQEDGSNDQSMDTTEGGYIFRGKIYTDVETPKKWNALKSRIQSKEDIQDIIEEAAYTWFNRMMAIKILEMYGFIDPQLSYDGGAKVPAIVQQAKRGKHGLQSSQDKALLLEYLQEDNEEQALGILLTDLCHRNRVMHDVFGRIDDYTEILLPQDLLSSDGLLELINGDGIPVDDYKEVELIGWLYQFYISDKKDEVFAGFKKNKKARAQDIPAATQIFTPKWIVKYMVENTIGKSYLDYNPDSDLKEGMKYLVESSEETVSPSLVNDITELTLIDPASGSGHILVTGFELLFVMYREEGYMASQAVEQILENNIYGLDIDDRAMQLARFAVLLKAASYDRGVLDSGTIPHIYSYPEQKHFTTEDIQLFLGDDVSALADLHEDLQLLGKGKNLGSTIKLGVTADQVAYLKSRYDYWVQQEAKADLGVFEQSIWYNLKPYLDVLFVLAKQYVAVVANPPYMGQKNMNADLKSYVNTNYTYTKYDLYSVFIEVGLNTILPGGNLGLINPPSWMFTSSFAKLRFNIIKNYTIDSLLNLGRGVFGVDFGSTAYVINNSKCSNKVGVYRNLFREKVTVDTSEQKRIWFLDKSFNRYLNNQMNFFKIKNNPLAFWLTEKVFEVYENSSKVEDHVEARVGLQTGENAIFRRNWFEPSINKMAFEGYTDNAKWFPYNSGGQYRKWYGNHDYVINWGNNGADIKNDKLYKLSIGKCLPGNSKPKNTKYYFLESGSWSKMTASGLTLRYYPKGFIFDVSGCSFFGEKDDLYYFIGLLNSPLKQPFIDAINQSFNYEVGQINNVPIVINDQKNIAINLVRKITEQSKLDWNSHETSWNYEKSSLLNEASDLESAFTTWSQNVKEDFLQLHANEEELNRIFIDIYGLHEELTPEVALKDITILQDELDRSALKNLEPTFRAEGKDAIELPIDKDEVLSQFVSYCIGLFLGRYRLDKKGLNIAHPNPTEEELAAYTYNGQTIEIDEDATIPLMGDNCAFPDDALNRLKNVMHAIWGEDTLTENINFLQECLGMDLHKWLTTKFWGYHTSMYKKKPIYWLFTSNPKKPQNAAFRVLVYMHRMDKFTVQKIQRKYLHPHQEFIKHERDRLSENEANLSKQEIKKLEQYRNWEIECRDYNEVLKELANQQIEIDLDDGVALNYPKFEGAVAYI